MEHSVSLSFVVLFIFYLFTPSNSLLRNGSAKYDTDNCMPTLANCCGYTFPRGDIVLEKGEPLEIFCVVNSEGLAKGLNSSSLVFSINDTSVPPSYISVINESTTRLYIKELEPSRSLVYCKSKGLITPICLNLVTVGLKPLEVKNFECISYNFESLNCSWDAPMTYVNTSYSLSYSVKRGERYLCPDLTKTYCLWNQTSDPFFRQDYENIRLQMFISNRFGNLTTEYLFKNYANMIPKQVENLQYLESTKSSFLIKWNIPSALHFFPKGLIFKIEYQSMWDSEEMWQVFNINGSVSRKKSSSMWQETVTVNLTGLKYPHTLYDIRVYLRSRAGVPPYKWSEPASITLRTRAARPAAPPRVDIGSFETEDPFFPSKGEGGPLRDIYLFWQQIPKEYENGPNFEYKVISVLENDIQRNIVPVEITKTYAKFKNLTFNSYTFEIVSSNEEGYSLTSSYIKVPSETNRLKPVSITKIAYRDNPVYEISWSPPEVNISDLESYTIFWCENKRDRPYKCTGVLNYTRVERDVTVVNITVPLDQLYQFAISANTANSSSGMVWAGCTVLDSHTPGLMKNVWIRRCGSAFCEIGWKLDCSDRIGSLKKFGAYYCPIVSPKNVTCRGDRLYEEITFDSSITQQNITGLKPYVTYIVHLELETNRGPIKSDTLNFTTLESAPDSPPREVTKVDVTNTSISLTWLPPRNMNGVLRYYSVCWKSNSMVERACIKAKDQQTSVTLTNLESYTNYTVVVAACTVSCSPYSAPLLIMTDIGYPSIMLPPKVRFINSTEIRISWIAPAKPGGLISFYLVKLQLFDSNVPLERIYRSQKLFIEVETSECAGKEKDLIYRVAVQAANLSPNNETLSGPWSPYGEGNCYSSHGVGLLILLYTVGAMAFLAIFLIFGCSTRWIWRKCKAMQDIEVKLPPLFEPVMDRAKDEELHLGLEAWEVEREMGLGLGPDEELLLEQKGKEVDSSGCGSGQDSAASSFTGATTVASDSGTEADQKPPSPDLFQASPALRQRVVPTPAASSASRGYVSHPPLWAVDPPTPPVGYILAAPLPSPAPPPSYCLLGSLPQKPAQLTLNRSLSDLSQAPSPTSN